MKLHAGIKQDENHEFYFAVGCAKLRVEPPVKLRVAGRFYPARGTDEKLYHLEYLDEETQEWRPLNA